MFDSDLKVSHQARGFQASDPRVVRDMAPEMLQEKHRKHVQSLFFSREKV